MVSHARYDHDRFTGRIRCTLTTKSPLIIPDTETADFFGLQAATPGHKSHRFFRLGNRVMIPGGPLKAMVSSVFETLTNSCYRVMEQKEHLSWRMEAGAPSAGRVIEKDGQLHIEPCRKESFRFYDTNFTSLFTDEQLEGVVTVNSINGKSTKGYLHVSGPCKIEIKANSGTTGTLPLSWKDVSVASGSKSAVFYDATGNSYTLSKVKEALFIPTNQDSLAIPHDVQRKFGRVMIKYLENPQAPPRIFRARPVLRAEARLSAHQPLLVPGDLVYYDCDQNGAVSNLYPVTISRKDDSEPIGTKLPNSTFRSCAQVCLEECEECRPEVCGLQLYREGRLNKGLCPACHLFGAAGYQGRVRFGFGRLEGEATWQKGPKDLDGQEQEYVTLPLQEAPRPTWVIPDATKKIPGRKFYVHHQGWRKIVAGREILDGAAIKPTENNFSFETLAKGNSFHFEVHFENLSDLELGLLLYSLELQEGLAHKLGRGKPFGFGSVTVAIDGLDLYDLAGTCWKPSPDTTVFITKGINKLADFSQNAPGSLDNLFRALSVNGMSEEITVCYPPLEEKSIDSGGPTRSVPGYIQLKERGANPNVQLAAVWTQWH